MISCTDTLPTLYMSVCGTAHSESMNGEVPLRALPYHVRMSPLFGPLAIESSTFAFNSDGNVCNKEFRSLVHTAGEVKSIEMCRQRPPHSTSLTRPSPEWYLHRVLT